MLECDPIVDDIRKAYEELMDYVDKQTALYEKEYRNRFAEYDGEDGAKIDNLFSTLRGQ